DDLAAPMIGAPAGVGGGVPGGAGGRGDGRVDDEVGLEELPGGRRGLGLGGDLGPGRFDRFSGVPVAVGGVAQHFPDGNAGCFGVGDHAGQLGTVRIVGRGGRDVEDQLAVVVGDHVGLVAVDPLRV